MALKVLLVYPNANRKVCYWGDIGAIAEPLALEYIGATAKSLGCDVRLLDLRLHYDDLDATLRDYRPDVVAVTGFSMHVLRALEVCREAKALDDDTVTVAGGHHASLEPIDFFEPEIDFVVVGEGTAPFGALLERLIAGQREPVVTSVHTRQQATGKYVFGGEADALSLENIVPPDRTLAPGDREKYYIDWMRPVGMIRTSLGCPYRCSFCSLWRMMNGRYKTRELDAVVDELRSMPERQIFLVDDEPFVNPKRMYALADRIAEAGIEKEFFSYSRIGSLLRDRALMQRWREIGLTRLLIGVETVFDWELNLYNKRQTRNEIADGLRAADDLGINLLCNFIVNPSYGDREFDGLREFIEVHNVKHPSFTVWTPLPGTPSLQESWDAVLYRQPNGRPNWDYFDLQHPVTPTKLPLEQFVKKYDGLYQRYIDRYAQSESPMTLAAIEERNQRMAALARLMLGGGRSAKSPQAN